LTIGAAKKENPVSHYVRIELFNASDDDYAKLHGHMKAEGFRRTVRRDGERYKLPTGTYRSSSFGSRSAALEAADRAASNTKKKHSVLVTRGSAKLSGLKKAN
jgi:hypothetical protein